MADIGAVLLMAGGFGFLGYLIGLSTKKDLQQNERAALGPQATCEITNGDRIILKALGRDVIFTPCVDGWYRCQNRDAELHKMLCAGAAGYDAGIYWKFDDTQGIWGIPASFIKQIQPRLDALTKTTKPN